jgi:hypothetical protein
VVLLGARRQLREAHEEAVGARVGPEIERCGRAAGPVREVLDVLPGHAVADGVLGMVGLAPRAGLTVVEVDRQAGDIRAHEADDDVAAPA